MQPINKEIERVEILDALNVDQFQVNVSSDDIVAGIPKEPSACALALGISHSTGVECEVNIRFDVPYVEFENGYRVTLEDSFREWIEQFDLNQKVETFSFDLLVDQSFWD